MERKRERENEERIACRCCLPILRHRSRSGVMHVHLTLFSSCNQRYLRFSLLLRRRVMTRKERGEDVYRWSMLGQTLNDESSQKSNPINCIVRQTKEKKKEKKKKKEEDERKKDGTVMAFFLSCEELTKSTQWINDIYICSCIDLNDEKRPRLMSFLFSY